MDRGAGEIALTSSGDRPVRVAILDRGDREARRRSAPEESRFLPLFRALADLGAQAERAVYDEAFADEVRRQLMSVDSVLVWVNPLQDGRDRSVLDAILREAAAAGVFVSGHPDVIAKLGTKEVLYTTRDIGWSADTHLYRSAAQMRRNCPRGSPAAPACSSSSAAMAAPASGRSSSKAKASCASGTPSGEPPRSV